VVGDVFINEPETERTARMANGVRTMRFLVVIAGTPDVE
jgi:hypothetical protein